MVTSNIYNPVDLSGAINANQNNFNNLAKGLNYAGDVLKSKALQQYQREFDNFALQVNNTLNDTMSTLYNSMPDKPTELEQEFMKNKNKLLENIKNDDLKLLAEKTYLTTKNVFLEKAKKNNEIRINSETKNNIFNSINSNGEFFNLYYNKMFNNELTNEDLANFNYTQDNINKLLQTQILGQHLPKNSLFTETDKKQIVNALNDLKIASGYRFFNEKYEADEEDFINTIYYWERKPQEVQDKYNLTQEEYEKILKHTKKIKENAEDIDYTSNGTTSNKVTLLAGLETEIETRFNVLNRTTKKGKTDLINAEEYKNIPYLADLNNRIEKAKALGLKDNKYQKYKEDIYNTVYNNFIKQDEKSNYIKGGKGWLSRKTVHNNLVDYLNKYLLPIDKVEKSQLYLEIATELQNQGLNLTSKEASAIGISDKVIQNTVRKIYNIPENENINNYLTNQKITKQLDFNSNVTNDYFVLIASQALPFSKKEKNEAYEVIDPLKLY